MKLWLIFVFNILLAHHVLADPIKVGVTAGPHAMIMEQVKVLAKTENLDIKIIEFNDFILPNAALNDKELDINCYQHQPFLDEQVAQRHYKIKSAGRTIVLPLGIYSKTFKNLVELPDKAKIAIPNDPTNGGRALKLLAQQGLIKLNATDNPTVLDIIDNPKNFVIIEIESPQLPRTLDDVAIAVINTDWVLLAGLDPQSGLVFEDKNSPYANIFAIRDDETRPTVQQLIQLYQSAPIKAYIEQTFKGAVIPTW